MNKIILSLIILLLYVNTCSCYYYSIITTKSRDSRSTSRSRVLPINVYNKFKMTATDNLDSGSSPSSSDSNTNTNTNTNNIAFENILNMRDLSSASPLKVSKNKIFRSGCPSRASASDIDKLVNTYKIQHFLDLRSQRELDEDEDLYKNQIYHKLSDMSYNRIKKSWEIQSATVTGNGNDNDNGNNRYFISLIDESLVKKSIFFRLRKRERLQALFWSLVATLSTRAEKKMKKIFVDYVNHGGLSLLNELVIDCSPTLVIEALKKITLNDGPIVFYCTAGKDRTGLLSMLILSILGATDEEIIDDYILSDGAYEELNDKKAMVASLQQEDLDADVFLTAKAPVMKHTLSYVRSKYGSIQSFLNTYGYDDQWQSKLIKKAGI